MKLTVLGMYGPYPPAGGATSGYLLQGGGTNVLLDCGSGILSRVQQFISMDDIDAVVLSHLHDDHAADMRILRYMIPFRRKFSGGVKEKIAVYAPILPEAEYSFLCSMEPFDVHPLTHGLEQTIGNMHFHFYSMSHPYPSFGMRITCEGKVFVFSGDTGRNDKIVSMIQGADAFLCDSAFLHKDLEPTSTHLSAREAAEYAKTGKVKNLILTHFLAHYTGNEHLAEASAVFPDTQIAEEMKCIEI